MFGHTHELAQLWSAKYPHWKSDVSKDYDFEFSNCPIDSAFIGPNLWNESFTISDLDNIKLDELSPNITSESMIDASSLNVFEELKPKPETISNVPPCVPAEKCNSPGSRNIADPQPTGGCHCSFNTLACYGPAPKVKNSVPSDQKTEQYWRRRTKNNAAAKRSRDARRMLEKQAHLKASILERENAQLRLEINRLTDENRSLRHLLDRSASSSVITAPAAPFQWL